jgi:hypothetical protein
VKFSNFKKTYLFILGIILCFLFIVPLSGAEQSNNDLTKEVFSVEDLKTVKGSLQEKGAASGVQVVATARQMTSTFDVKVPLNDKCNAIISLGKPAITDLTGRDIKQNYNAVIGFQIVLH